MQFFRSVDSPLKLSIAMTSLLARSSAKICSGCPLLGAQLANSVSQGVWRNPPDGGTLEFLPHRFQIFHFVGATLAAPEVKLASQRIHRVQFSVEKSVQDEFPFRTGAGCAYAGFGRRRPDHGDALHVAERERQLAGLTMTLPFMFGWIEHK
jgi:hypothetical protein